MKLASLHSPLQRRAECPLEPCGITAIGVQRVKRRNDHRQQVGAFAIAVYENLADERSTGKHRFEVCDRDEFPLRQLQYVVAAVDIDKPVGLDLGHDVAGAVVAVDVERRGRDLRPLVVARCRSLRLDEQFASGIGLVG